MWTGEPGEPASSLDLALIYCAALYRSPNLSGLYRSQHHTPLVLMLSLWICFFQKIVPFKGRMELQFTSLFPVHGIVSSTFWVLYECFWVNEWMSKKVGERKRLGVTDLNWHQSSSPWDIFSQLSTKIPKKAARIENSQCWHPRLTGSCCQNLGGISINIRQMEPDWDKQSGTYSSFIVWNRAPLQDKRREGNTQLLPHLQPQTLRSRVSANQKIKVARRGGSFLHCIGDNPVGKILFLLAGPCFYYLETEVSRRQKSGDDRGNGAKNVKSILYPERNSFQECYRWGRNRDRVEVAVLMFSLSPLWPGTDLIVQRDKMISQPQCSTWMPGWHMWWLSHRQTFPFQV